ncbi:Endoglucanase D Short=EGD [Fibrisoma limi BUZ 3]|uniref:Endoglucanase D Short=EGD n=1 Tax=Fibrisoma limi BUZ 3 TaxID=1185876 RepID=I2GFU8_9BACT|nr:glycoside hydrolase family 9 protein [Fibrisoma limi]CCH52773.1 Endoglucanase D Short=EGD [Fibrisoma limi BUZ 3]
MKLKHLFSLCLLLLFHPWAKAQEIVDVLPLTDRILVVHINEGYAQKHQRGQRRGDESIVYTPLNLGAATTLTSYQLSSSNDPSYSAAKNPTDIGRKSKGTSWVFLCQSYNNSTGCVNTSPDHASEHFLYLYLPSPLQRDKAYTLNTGSLGVNGSTWTFTYNEKTIRSEAVHVNQIGYKPNAALKFGYVYHWMGSKGGLDLSTYAGKPFWVVNKTTNQVAFSGTLQLAKSKTNPETGQAGNTPNANFAGADVYECNFSALTAPGDYVLAVEGIGSSFPFRIDQNVYAEVFGSVMNGLFKNRSGIAITQGELSDQNRPAPHNPNLTPGFTNRLYYSTARDYDYPTDGGGAPEKAAYEAGKKGLINTWGWYQDAGDWDGYFSHTRIPVNLMFLYETFPNKFTDNALKLPEKNNGQPDILDEARWLLRYLHRTRHAIKDAGYGTGGVGARVSGDLWGGDERADGTTKASWDDTDRDWYVSGEDVWTTFRYAGMAAQYAHCLSVASVSDAEGINWQQEAIDAYAWAISKQTAADETPRRDYNLKFDRLYAAAMLYRLTGTATYHDQFKADFSSLNLNDVTLQDDVRFGLWAYLLVPGSRPTESAIVSAIQAKTESSADYLLVSSAQKRAARWGGDFYYPMLVGQGSSPMTTEGIMAYGLLKNIKPDKSNEYLQYIGTTADYFLGNNPLNQTWVTGLGERSPREIFHMDSWYSGNTNTTRTGIVPYGPWLASNPRPAQQGWWDHHWPERTGSLYPANLDEWPGHERWFEQRTSPLATEWTVHQSQLWSIMTYGALFAAEEPPFQNVPVTGLTVTPQSLTVLTGQTGTLTASVQPGNATNPAVTWESSNTAVVTVLGGTVTGVQTGTATVTARTVDGNFTVQIPVTVSISNTPPTCEGNRFVNPGFEDPDLSAYDVRNNVTIVSDANSGSKAAQVGSGNADGYMHQQFYNAPPGAYTFRVWTKKVGTPSYALVSMKFIDAAGNEITTATVQTDIPNGTGYQQVVLGPVQAPANTNKVLVGFPVGSGGTVLVDDVCLTVETTTPVTPCEGNKLVNASFEETDLSAYDVRNNISIVSDAHSGSKAARIGSDNGDGYMHQQFYNPPQGAYTFKVWTKKTGNPGYALVQVKFIDADGNEITASTVQTDIPGSDTYQQLVIGPLQTPANTNKILIGFPAGPGGTVLIDDLCLTVAPVSDAQAPTAPTNLTATGVQSTALQLNWSASADNVGVTKYEVYRNDQKIGETTTPSFSVTGLSPNTAYAFTVKAFDAANNASGASNVVNVTTLASDVRYVLNPTHDKDSDGNGSSASLHASLYTSSFYKFDLSSVSGTPTRAILRLNKLTATAYLAYLGVHPDSQDSWTESGATNPEQATVIATRSAPGSTGPVLEFDVTDYIKAELGAGRNKIASFQLNNNVGSWTDVGSKESDGPKPELVITMNGFVDTQAPTAPSALTATETAQGGLRLSWAQATDNVGVTNYEVYNGTTLLTTLPGSAYSLLVKGLSPGTAYTFSVKARDESGNGTSSAPLTASTASVTTPTVTLGPTDDTSTEDNALGTGAFGTFSLYATAFTRFDLANVQGNVSTAKFRLFSSGPLSLTLKATNTKTWTEGNRSALPTATGDVVKTITVGGEGKYYEIDVTDLVRAALSADKVLSWAINSDQAPWKDFRTKEAFDNQPQLVLAFENTPSAPTFSGLPASGSACAGQSLTLSASCASGTPQWQGNPQGQVNGGSIVVPSTGGTYSYSAVCTNGALSSEATATSVKVNEVPAPNYATQAGQLYPAGKSSLTVTQYTGNVTLVATNCSGQLSWTGPNNTSGTGNIVVGTDATGTFTFTGVCRQGECTSAGTTVRVTVQAGALKMETPLYNCATGQLTIRTSGGNGNAIEYQIPSISNGWQSTPTFTVDEKRRDKSLKLRARQRPANGGGWNDAERDFTPTSACSSAGRLATSEASEELRVTILGNPVSGDQFDVEVRGAGGQPLRLLLTDLQGRQINELVVEQAVDVERHTLSVGRSSTGILLLKVSTPQQSLSEKVLKQ